jgi:hypothetical protein
VPESSASQGPGGGRGARRPRSGQRKEPEGRQSRRRPAQPEAAAAGPAAPAGPGAPAEPLALDELLARDFVAPLPFGGGPAIEAAGPEAAAAPPVTTAVLVRAPIDRSDPVEVFSIDRVVKAADGTVRRILRRPYGFPAGRLPGDPGPVPAAMDPREICSVLSPAAAARCLLGRGYS